jgi:glutathione S-transferase
VQLLLAPADGEAMRRARLADQVLRVLDGHLAGRDFLVAGRYTIADIAVYGHTHRAGSLEDVMPYGANAAPGAGRSICS